MKIILSCKEAARIVSEELDTRLSLSKKIILKIHLMLCKGCTLYQKQIKALRNLFHDYNNKVGQLDVSSDRPFLPDDSRARLKERLKKELL